jgi:hypothetical protein
MDTRRDEASTQSFCLRFFKKYGYETRRSSHAQGSALEFRPFRHETFPRASTDQTAADMATDQHVA